MNPHTQSWEMHFYVEDTYKVNPRLTLNYGVRYKYQAPFSEASNFASNYDIATNSVLLAGRGGNSAGLTNSRWDDVAPRLGFAFQATRKTVLRGGYGIFYSPENDAREDILTKNYPFAELDAYENYYYNGPCVVSPQNPVCDGLYHYQLDSGIQEHHDCDSPRRQQHPHQCDSQRAASYDVLRESENADGIHRTIQLRFATRVGIEFHD